MRDQLLEKKTERKAGRLDFIDSLRGLAALYVVIFHIALVPEFKVTVPEFIKPIIMNGGSGVTLFFVISAFTLCYTLHGRINEKNSVQYFYVRRIFRIVPLYYIWLFGTYIFEWGRGVFAYLWADKLSAAIYVFFLYNFVPDKQEGIVWASWTLGVEMIFYLLFPFIFKWACNLKRCLILYIISIGIAAIHHYFTLGIPGYNSFISLCNQLPVFVTGMISFFLYEKFGTGSYSQRLGPILLIAAIVAFLILPYFLPYLKNFPVLFFMAAIYSCLLLGLYICPVKIIVNKITLFLGLISYSLYLTHPKVIYNLSNLYEYLYSINLGNSISFLTCVLVTVLPLVLLAYISYLLIEKPAMNFGRLIISNHRRRNEQKISVLNPE